MANQKFKNIDAFPNCVRVTYAELLELRNRGQLVSGTNYRITDYEFTTCRTNVKSAGHPFDIIVTALDERTLSEEAHAAINEASYFFLSNEDGEYISPFVTKTIVHYNDGDALTEIFYEDSDSALFKVGQYMVGGLSYTPPSSQYEGRQYTYKHNSDGTITAYTDKPTDSIRNQYTTPPYFATSDLGAWKIRYTIDNDKSKYDWAKDGGSDYIHLAENGKYKRYKEHDENGHWAWAYVEDEATETLDLGDCAYTDPSPKVGGKLYNGTHNSANTDSDEIEEVNFGGKGVIYHMEDEFGNEFGYDFKNALFKKGDEWVYAVYTDSLGEIEDYSIENRFGCCAQHIKDLNTEMEYGWGFHVPIGLPRNLFYASDAEENVTNIRLENCFNCYFEDSCNLDVKNDVGCVYNNCRSSVFKENDGCTFDVAFSELNENADSGIKGLGTFIYCHECTIFARDSHIFGLNGSSIRGRHLSIKDCLAINFSEIATVYDVEMCDVHNVKVICTETTSNTNWVGNFSIKNVGSDEGHNPTKTLTLTETNPKHRKVYTYDEENGFVAYDDDTHAIDARVTALEGKNNLTMSIVSELPAVADAVANTIYLVTNADGESGNLYDEYVLANGAFERVGSASINLDEYVKAEVQGTNLVFS